jgi:hypothetical protein
VAQPHQSMWHESTPEVERILMVDFVSTQARAKGDAPCTNCEGGWTKAVVADPMNTSPHQPPMGWTCCTTN